MKKAHDIWLFTNRIIAVFDEMGGQIPEYQKAVDCYKLNKKLAIKMTNEADEFHISGFREWTHEISRREMQCLLGIRMRKMNEEGK